MPVSKFAFFLSLSMLCNPISSWAKENAPDHLITLRGDHISSILGASREPHTMKSLARQRAPAEYVNDDLERLTFNEGPCIYVAGLSSLSPPATYGVVVECFDLVTAKESKSFAYSTDAMGNVVAGGKLLPVGEYGKGDPLFDLAAWNWVSEHISPELARKIGSERAQGAPATLANLYKVNPKGEQPGPDVSAPVLTHAVDAEFSDAARQAHISGLSIVSVVIDTQGLPQHVRSVLPLGYGMDEQAVKAIEQYRFQSSKLQGKPVPVQITIEVHFH